VRVIINGTSEPFRSSLKTSFDPARGIVTTEVWKMAGGDSLTGLAAQYLARGYQYELDSNPRISSLTVTSPTPQGGEQDVATDQWQIIANEIQLDVFEAPVAVALGYASLAKIKLAEKDHDEGSAPDTSGWTSDEISLFNLLVKGVKFYPVGQHVLRHTTNVSANYTSNVADSNIDAIYTNALLNNEIGSSAYWTYPAPARIQSIVSARATGTTDGGALRWGWRKLPSNETTAAHNRIDITTEYWFGGYPYFLYDNAV
jgi:hypothetical protein